MTTFTSAWAPEFRAFLNYKRSLGIKYKRSEYMLRSLDRFLAGLDRSQQRRRIDASLLDWLERPGHSAGSIRVELGVARHFHGFLRRQGHRLREPAWPQLPTTSAYYPHILSTAHVRELLRLTRGLGRPPFRRDLYRALLLVLYCTGMRFGEAVRLRLRDVDLSAGTIFVIESKGRSRWVPIHRSLSRELEKYLSARGATGNAGGPPDDPFFVSGSGSGLRVATASDTVRRLLVSAGLKPEAGRVGPRPYDLRHTFAVHRLTRWYRAGVDIQSRLPWLSAYMGHDDLLGTETYLTATPELLSLAAHRFHRRYLTAEAPK